MSKRSTKSAKTETQSNVNVEGYRTEARNVVAPTAERLPAQRDPNCVAYRFMRTWATNGRLNRSISETMLGGGAKELLGVDGNSTDEQKAMALLAINRGLVHTQEKPSKYTSFFHPTDKGGIETIVVAKHGARIESDDRMPF